MVVATPVRLIASEAYDRKKYVWKLVYVHMRELMAVSCGAKGGLGTLCAVPRDRGAVGIDVDFGHMEMIALVSAPSYSEKLVGCERLRLPSRRWSPSPPTRALPPPCADLSVSVMLRNTEPTMTLVIQAIRNDLQSTQDPIQCLALCAIANIGGKELAESVAPDVQRILYSRSIFPVVRKKAALCLLRLARISRDLLPAEANAKRLITLLEDKNLGVVLSVVTLLLGLAERDPAAYEGATGHLLVWLTRLAVQRQVPEDYIYHGTPCPWLQVRGERCALEPVRSVL